MKFNSIFNAHFLVCILTCIVLFTGCRHIAEEMAEDSASVPQKRQPEVSSEIKSRRLIQISRLVKGNVSIPKDKLYGFASLESCTYDNEKASVIVKGTLEDIPSSDDAFLYFFSQEAYEKLSDLPKKEPVFRMCKATEWKAALPFEKNYRFVRFVPALRISGEYVPLSEGMFIQNIEDMAVVREDPPKPISKKGLLIDPSTLGTELLSDLNIKHAIYNMPLSLIIGETTNPEYETIEYEFNGRTYRFNGDSINTYDSLLFFFNAAGMMPCMIILNDWNEEHPEIIHPMAREKTRGAYYYAMNTEEEDGTELLKATAAFLGERYGVDSQTRVYNWVIANEVNQNNIWNFMKTDDLDYYTEEFEQCFRIFYNGLKSGYSASNIYFSLDNTWNITRKDGSRHTAFGGREFLETFNRKASVYGSYDWGLAIHPYPNPLTRVDYWNVKYDKTPNSPVLTIMNLSSVLDMLKDRSYRNSDGEIRSVVITELGFTSRGGEKRQSAAFAYCYYIIDNNPYIDAFFMNRQTDAPEEVAQGLSFGIYTRNHEEKEIKDVYANIDGPDGEQYYKDMLDVIGADSLEEALSQATGPG